MDKDVYGNSAVAEILAKDFIAVKLNPELSEQVTYDGNTMTNGKFAQNFGVSGYPTTLFLDAEAKPITILPGFVEQKEFQSILSYIGENHYKTMNYDTYRSSKPQQ